MSKIPVTNIRGSKGDTGDQGPQGNQGPQGERGLPGVNAVPADEAVAAYVAAPGSETGAALRAAIGAEVDAAAADPGSVLTGAIVGSVARASDGQGQASAPVGWASEVLVKSAADMKSVSTLPTLYYPSLVAVPESVTAAPGRYLCYFSTNHDAGAGGVGMMYADHPLGPWTVQPGVVFVDTVDGSQTETPCVYWVSKLGQFVMLYQQLGAGLGLQSTLYATSPDGVTWTRGGLACDWPSLALPGDGHTGYATHAYVNGLHVAYTLAGGDAFPRFAIWYSQDGMHYVMDRAFLPAYAGITGNNEHVAIWLDSVFSWSGKLWGTITIRNSAPGGAPITEWQHFVGELDSTLKTFVGDLITIPWRPETTVEHGGVLYGAVLNQSTGLYVRELSNG